MKPFTTIREMVGKITNDVPSILRTGMVDLFGSRFTNEVDYSRNDYDLWKAIYWASTIGRKGVEYQMAAPLAKPIINIMTGFVIGKGFTAELDNSSKDKDLEAAENQITTWLEENMSDLYDFAKFGYRDGDSYLYIDDYGDVSLLAPEGVTVMKDPITGKTNGYDVQNVVWIVPADSTKAVEWIYLKMYRTDSTLIIRWKKQGGSKDKAETVFSQVFTTDGPVTPTAGQLFNPGDLAVRRLPIKHFANEAEADAIYGNSELQNVLVMFKNYSGILLQGTKGVSYNSSPIPWLKGVQDPSKLARNSQDRNNPRPETDKVEWNQKSILYLTGENAAAGFLQANGIMDDVSKLLEIFFYLFVQGAETPEFTFGTAVASSKASTDTQMPILIRKVERKQRQLRKILRETVETFIERQQNLSNPVFLKLRGKEVNIRINFPPVSDDDKTLTLEAVQWGVQVGIISNETALQLILGDQIKDVPEEIAAAAKDAEKAKADAASSQDDRLAKELAMRKQLLDAGGTPTDTNPNEDPNNLGGDANA